MGKQGCVIWKKMNQNVRSIGDEQKNESMLYTFERKRSGSRSWLISKRSKNLDCWQLNSSLIVVINECYLKKEVHFQASMFTYDHESCWTKNSKIDTINSQKKKKKLFCCIINTCFWKSIQNNKKKTSVLMKKSV